MVPKWLLFLLLVPLRSFSQEFRSDLFGAQLKAIISIGSHQSSVGLRVDSYVNLGYAQINLGTAYRFHAHNFGNRVSFGEWRHQAGLVLMGGRETNPENFIFDGALHQSRRPYSVGLSHIWYVDRKGTSQRSGVMAVGIKRVDLQFENDIFAGQGRDKFRTGDFQVSYRDAFNRAAIGVRLWTGETRGSVWNKDPQPGMPGGYRDLSSLPYGKTSAGLLYVSGQKMLGFGQFAGGEIGFDSEQVRYIFQNRISHDLVLLPRKIPRHTPHYPRLDEYGLPVYSKSEMRKTLPLYRVYFNEVLTY